MNQLRFIRIAAEESEKVRKSFQDLEEDNQRGARNCLPCLTEGGGR